MRNKLTYILELTAVEFVGECVRTCGARNGVIESQPKMASATKEMRPSARAGSCCCCC